MKFEYAVSALVVAFALSHSAHAANLTEISKMSDSDLEKFLVVSLKAEKLAKTKYNTDVAFDVKAYRVSDGQQRQAQQPVESALAKIGYGDLKPVELSDIDDQISDTVEAAYLADLAGIPAATQAQMEKLVDEGQRNFSYGDERVRVFSATGMDSNHYDINAIIAYDLKAKEVLIVASQKID